MCSPRDREKFQVTAEMLKNELEGFMDSTLHKALHDLSESIVSQVSDIISDKVYSDVYSDEQKPTLQNFGSVRHSLGNTNNSSKMRFSTASQPSNLPHSNQPVSPALERSVSFMSERTSITPNHANLANQTVIQTRPTNGDAIIEEEPTGTMTVPDEMYRMCHTMSNFSMVSQSDKLAAGFSRMFSNEDISQPDELANAQGALERSVANLRSRQTPGIKHKRMRRNGGNRPGLDRFGSKAYTKEFTKDLTGMERQTSPSGHPSINRKSSSDLSGHSSGFSNGGDVSSSQLRTRSPPLNARAAPAPTPALTGKGDFSAAASSAGSSGISGPSGHSKGSGSNHNNKHCINDIDELVSARILFVNNGYGSEEKAGKEDAMQDCELRIGLLKDKDDQNDHDESCFQSEGFERPDYESELSPTRKYVRDFVTHPYFEPFVGVMVILNSAVIGWETQCMIEDNTDWAFQLEFMETIFCLMFVTELVLRIYVHGCDQFCASTTANWKWNTFDCCVIGLQVMERAVFFYHQIVTVHDSATHFFQLAFILRIIRIARLVRIVSIVEELHTIASSVVTSLAALLWTLFLLFITMYIFSILFAQAVVSDTDAWSNDQMRYYFGGMPRTMLTMFEVITAGVNWDTVAYPIMQDVGPVMGALLILYIAFCLFAMLNMATGVFVEAAVRKSREDSEVFAANHISRIFFGGTEAQEVDYEMFKQKLTGPDMQEYFKSINVDPSEAWGLFKLIDVDGGGTIDADELITGLLRLRGGATALELSILTYEVLNMNKTTLQYQQHMEFAMGTVLQVVAALSNTAKLSTDLVEEMSHANPVAFHRASVVLKPPERAQRLSAQTERLLSESDPFPSEMSSTSKPDTLAI